mmetsp:Transcript_130261/g.324779  ORF Transcript_130261/g.324779 Transcript_130261/m.324779 type:complete len:233 (-) Transcript_130261:376-1074(-)
MSPRPVLQVLKELGCFRIRGHVLPWSSLSGSTAASSTRRPQRLNSARTMQISTPPTAFCRSPCAGKGSFRSSPASQSMRPSVRRIKSFHETSWPVRIVLEVPCHLGKPAGHVAKVMPLRTSHPPRLSQPPTMSNSSPGNVQEHVMSQKITRQGAAIGRSCCGIDAVGAETSPYRATIVPMSRWHMRRRFGPGSHLTVPSSPRMTNLYSKTPSLLSTSDLNVAAVSKRAVHHG